MVCRVIKFDVLPCSRCGSRGRGCRSSGRKEPEDEGTGALSFHALTDMALPLGLIFDFAIGLE